MGVSLLLITGERLHSVCEGVVDDVDWIVGVGCAAECQDVDNGAFGVNDFFGEQVDQCLPGLLSSLLGEACSGQM